MDGGEYAEKLIETIRSILLSVVNLCTMIYREKEISGLLEPYIKCCWFFDSENESVRHTILPDGYFDLIFQFQNEVLQKRMLTGTWIQPIDINIEEHTRMFGVRFRLLAAEYIWNNSINTLLDNSMELPCVEQLADPHPNDSLDCFFMQITDSIRTILPEEKAVDVRKKNVFRILYEQHGDISVSELANQVGWSSRQMNRWFNAQYGLSLKTFSNILKCRASYKSIAEGQLYPGAIYYDQAHFIKEIKRYTGVTPKELHQNKNDRFLQLSTIPKK